MTNVTGVLKKIGTVLFEAGGVASQVMGFPFLSTLLSGSKAGGMIELGLSDLGKVAQIVSVVEAGFAAIDPSHKTGSAKLKAATPMVKQIVLDWANSNLPGHNKLKVTPTEFDNHVGAFTSAFVDILNDFGE